MNMPARKEAYEAGSGLGKPLTFGLPPDPSDDWRCLTARSSKESRASSSGVISGRGSAELILTPSDKTDFSDLTSEKGGFVSFVSFVRASGIAFAARNQRVMPATRVSPGLQNSALAACHLAAAAVRPPP